MNCFDIHSDIWTDVTIRRLQGETSVFKNHHLERLKKGGVEGSIFVLWVDPPFDVDHEARMNDIIKCVNAEVAEAESNGDFVIVKNYGDIIKAKEDGVFYILKGIEGLSCIGEDADKLNEFYEFGTRLAMLTWNEVNALGAGASSGVHSGLTDLGKKVARKIQDLGMILDVSHLNVSGFWDVADLATKPFIASHSNCSALSSVHRNLTDDQLRAIRDVNGIVGLCAFNLFIDSDYRKQTVDNLARHASHMIDIMGINHVACGFDFFEFIEDESTLNTMTSMECQPTKNLQSASDIPNLFNCFKKMGLTEEEMEKIAYKNALRVIKECIQ